MFPLIFCTLCTHFLEITSIRNICATTHVQQCLCAVSESCVRAYTRRAYSKAAQPVAREAVLCGPQGVSVRFISSWKGLPFCGK